MQGVGKAAIVAAIGCVMLLLVGSLAANAIDDNPKDKGGASAAPAPAACKKGQKSTKKHPCKTKPKGTPSTSSTTTLSGSSTTSTTAQPTTTTTTPGDVPKDCTAGNSFWENLTCANPPADPGASDDGPLDLGPPCTVQLDKLDYNFYHPGKLAVENFREPFKGNINTDEGLKRFVQGALQLACEDPVAMASYASNTVLKDQKLTVEQQNHLVLKYLDHLELWQRHLDKLTERWNSAVLVRVVSNDGRPAETDAQRHVGGKRPPELFTEDLKGSCTQIVEVWMDGEVDQLCVQCFQFVRRMSDAPPAIPVTPQVPKRPKKPCTRCGGTTTTTRPRGTTTTTRPPRTTTTTTRPPRTTTTTKPVTTTTKGPQPDPCDLYPHMPGC